MVQMRWRSRVRRSLIACPMPRRVRVLPSNACLPTRPCSARGPVGPSRSRTLNSTAVCRRAMRARCRPARSRPAPGMRALSWSRCDRSPAASAVAGFDQVVCGVTPLYVCNPYETPGMTYDQATEALQHAAANPSDQGRLMRLRQYDGNAPYAAEDYGFLSSPTLGSDEMSLIDSIAVVRPAACFLQRGVNFRPGLVRSVREGFNVRFDIYEGAMSANYNDSNYRPAQNVRKGYVLASGDQNQNACAARRGANWPIGSPPNQVTGLPLDL